MNYLTDLECSHCHEHYYADQLLRLCPACGYPLLARYDLTKAAREIDLDELAARPAGLWRYEELLPVRDPAYRVSLGEGGKPILPLHNLANALACTNSI